MEKPDKKFKNYIISENKNRNVCHFSQNYFYQKKTETIIDSIFETLSNSSISVVGPELIFWKIYDKIDFIIGKGQRTNSQYV